MIMYSPLVSGNNWNATTDSFRNMVQVRDGLFSPPVAPGNNSSYVIRLLFSQPFEVQCGTAYQYKVTKVDLTGTPGLIDGTAIARLPSVQWAGSAPDSGDLTIIPPGWMAQTVVQFQQTAGQPFMLFVDGSFADACGNPFTFHIHPEGDASPGDTAEAAAAAGPPGKFSPSPE